MLTPRAAIVALALLVAAAAGCDAFLEPATAPEEPAAREFLSSRSSTAARSREAVGVCMPQEGGGYVLRMVAPADVRAHYAAGAVRPGSGQLDEACRPAGAGTSCPCLTAADLALAVHGAEPQPRLFFDTYNFWGEDHRRTEVRSILEVDGRTLEEVAALYLPQGLLQDPRPVMCWRQDVQEDPTEEAGWLQTSTTVALSIPEAEACRRELYAFAAALECQGPACGTPYSEALRDPDFPPSRDQRLRRLHVELDRLRAAIDPQVSRFRSRQK